jgi:hypothetical protein
LEAAGIQVVTGCGGIVRRVLDRFLAELYESSDAMSQGRTAGDAKLGDAAESSRATVKGGRRARQRDFEEDVDNREEWYLRSLPDL